MAVSVLVFECALAHFGQHAHHRVLARRLQPQACGQTIRLHMALEWVKAGVMLARALGRRRIGFVKVGDNCLHRRVQAVQV